MARRPLPLIKQCNAKFTNGDSVGEIMLGYFNVDCEAAVNKNEPFVNKPPVNKNELSLSSPPPVGVTTAHCPQCNFAQCSLDECSVLVV